MADLASVQAVSGNGVAQKALAVMGEASGKPYKWGGKTLEGFDCSGFVSYVFKALFVDSSASFGLDVAGFKTSDLFEDVDSAQPGDIVIFPAAGSSPNHIGIVYSADTWIGSQSSTGVAKVKFSNPYWSARSSLFRRCKSFTPASVALGRTVFEGVA